eukprot:m.297894 g.297894  ORF g.297894 m.297894 type:complete len:294 (-) comp20088_c2_seq7:555-1436(-)
MEQYEDILQRYYLQAELREIALQEHCYPGIYVLPRESNPFLWDGVVFVRQGDYNGGTFKFTLNIPEDFPCGIAPSVTFSTKIFHPSVDPSSRKLDVFREFPTWNSPWEQDALAKDTHNWIWQICAYIFSLLHNVEPTSTPLNLEASQLYNNDRNLFLVKVEESIRTADIELYSVPSDPFTICFSKWQKVHDDILEQLLQVPQTSASDQTNSSRDAVYNDSVIDVNPCDLKDGIESVLIPAASHPSLYHISDSASSISATSAPPVSDAPQDTSVQLPEMQLSHPLAEADDMLLC